MTKRSPWLALSSAVASVLCLVVLTQPIAARVQSGPLTEKISTDPRITVGTLPNGLRYYIRANPQPRNRAELRLAVNAGSVLEDDDQRGLAHFVEHMAFNGTEHFPGQDVGSFMQSIGMRSGAHVNAHTTFDETVYQLQIPTDNAAVIDRSLQIMEDWAHNVTFDPAEVDKERGVILEEWRLGLGGGARIQDAQFPVLLKGSRYADRLPIGKPEILQNFSHARLRKFYTDWYRPDLIAVVAVGDFSVPAIEARIKARFSGIPPAVSPRPRPEFPVPDHPETLYAVATDAEETSAVISVQVKSPAPDQTTIGAYRTQIIEGLFNGMMSLRLQELARQPSAPFLAAQTDRGLIVRTAETSSLNAAVPEDGIERGLEALIAEINRVARFGFTPTELERQRLNIQRNLENAVAEKDQHPSDSLADEYIRNFIQAEPIPGIVYENELYKRFMPQVGLGEINALARTWAQEKNRVVLVSAPKKPGLVVPDAAKLQAAIKRAGSSTLTAYVDAVAGKPLLDPIPEPGRIAKTTTNEALGLTEWTLANGVRVVLAPTTFKPDEILFRAVSFGGTSLASDADLVAAQTADEVVSQGGVGQLSAVDLSKSLAGKSAFVRPDIAENEQRLFGAASRKDLETLFQLIYLSFTAPRADPVVFGIMKDRWRAALSNRSAQPETAFNDALEAALSQSHPRARPLTAASVDQMSLERSMAFYKARFADAGGFTFAFVGSFDLEAIKPLVERYLGSLPAKAVHETWKDNGIRPPDRVVRTRVEQGLEPKSQVGIVFTGPFQFDEMHRLALRIMAETLDGNLHTSLREELGGTYNVSVEPGYAKVPTSSFRLTISFGCNPARVDDLVKEVFQQIDRYKELGPTQGQIADAQATLSRDYETNSRENGYLLGQLLFKYQYGEDVREVFSMTDLYRRLTPEMVRDAARTYLDTSKYVQVTLVPQVK